jgi:hypothetical protein
MGDFTDKTTRRAKAGPHGDRPAEPGMGFKVNTRELAGQSCPEEEQVCWYEIVDRHDDRQVFVGLEERRLIRETTARQVELLARAGGLTNHAAVLTELGGSDPEQN